MVTCKELDTVKDLILVCSVFEEIISLKVFVAIGEDD